MTTFVYHNQGMEFDKLYFTVHVNHLQDSTGEFTTREFEL